MTEKSKFRDYFAEAEQKSKEEGAIKKPKRGSRYERHRVARILAIQSHFEAEQSDASLKSVAARYQSNNFKVHSHPIHPDKDLYLHLITALGIHQEALGDMMSHAVVGNWTPSNMDTLVQAILWVGMVELLVPYGNNDAKPSIVISDYVEITKGFFEDKEAGYVNKVLDETLRSL